MKIFHKVGICYRQSSFKIGRKLLGQWDSPY